MQISVTEAEAQFADLVRRAEAGEDIVLTRHGSAVVRLVAFDPLPGNDLRRRVLEAARLESDTRATAGPSAARSQDFLYEEEGLPG